MERPRKQPMSFTLAAAPAAGNSQPQRNWPSWLRFDLRDLALFIVVVSLVCIWLRTPTLARQQTGRELDVAIFGKGYFQIYDAATGQTAYTRDGRLHLNGNGELHVGRATDGWLLQPGICIPQDTTAIEISVQGEVFARNSNGPNAPLVGSIQLANFINPEGLEEISPRIFLASDEAGTLMNAAPGTQALGRLVQGWIENSPATATQPQSVALVVLGALVCWLWIEIRSLRKRLDYARVHEETSLARLAGECKPGDPLRETPSPSRLALQRAS